MAVLASAPTGVDPLTPDEVAQIPSAALPLGLQISHLLAEFTRLSIQLFAHLSNTSPSLAVSNSSASPIEAVYDALASIDDKLASLLVMYDAHQRRQRRIEALVDELGALEGRWRTSAQTLERCVADLAPVVASGARDRAAISTASRARPTPTAVLSYARLLAPFTSAPPSSLFPPEVKLKGVGATDPTGRSLPAGAIPPFPTEATMRRGRLQFGREGLLQGYLGEMEEVGGRRDPDTGALPPPEPAGTRPPADAAARLEHEAKMHASARAGDQVQDAEGDAGDFVFDLDLNPDM
ncbi:hypothetical protein JCM8202_002864 [Rhodotorula sphaerocarpa]